MNAPVLKSLTLFTQIILCACVSVTKYQGPDIISKSKIELKPFYVPAGIDDTIIISAPIVNSNSLYFLHKPNNDVMQLNLNVTNDMFNNKKLSNEDYNDITIKYIKGYLKAVIIPVNRFKVFNLNYGSHCYDTKDTFDDFEKSLKGNDFMIGPLSEEDHGNWVLSVYYKGYDDEWIELFQVITIEVKESIPTYPEKPKLNVGDDFKLRFAYPVKNLQTCEITAPRATFDRFYDRDKSVLDSCGFSIPNITKYDEGLWRIIGVGNIVYEANVYLEINKET